LQVPPLDATTGIKLGGKTFDGCSDCTLQGSAAIESVAETSGAYSFSVPPVRAVLLTVLLAN